MSVSDAIAATYDARRALSHTLSSNKAGARMLREDLYERALAFRLTGNSDMSEYLTSVGDAVFDMADRALSAYDHESMAQSHQIGAEISGIFATVLKMEN